MNKKLIAAAVAAGLAAPMAAQADATWYGHLQAEIFSGDSDFVTSTGGAATPTQDGHVVNAGSRLTADGIGVDDEKRGRLGVKGDADLGGDLKAIFKFEFQVETTTANVDDGDREAFVGLKGGFGSLKLGSVKSPYKYFGGVKYDPFVATHLEARRYGGQSQGVFGQNGFFQRSLSYEYKNGPGYFWVTYSPNESESRQSANTDDGDYAIGYKFSAKKWEAFIAAAHNEDNSTASLDFDALKIGGAVKFGAGKLQAQIEDTNQEVAGGGDDEGQVIYLNYNHKFGKNTLVATYAMGEVDLDASGTDQENDMVRLGIIHKFTKKTRLWAGWSSHSYDNLNGSTAATQNGDYTAISVGMRHDF